jgi:biotin carboxyl carrier protein
LATRKYVIDGKSFAVEIVARTSTHCDVVVNGKRYEVERAAPESSRVDNPVSVGTAPVAARSVRSAPGEVRAPMAGRILKLHSSPGDIVAAGTPLIVLDAMKMENIIQAPRAGHVNEIAVSVGDTVLQGALLLRLG